MLHMIYWKLLPKKVSYVIIAFSLNTIHQVLLPLPLLYTAILPHCAGLYRRSSLKHCIPLASYNELVRFLAGCMPAQWSFRIDRVVEYILHLRFFTGQWILWRQQGVYKKVVRKPSLLPLDKFGLILNEVQVKHTCCECITPSHDNLRTGNCSCWVPWNIMSYPFYDLYRHKLNTHEHLFKILVYRPRVYDTDRGSMCD